MFQIRKGVHQGCILSPCLFNLNEEYIMQNAGLDETHAGNKIAGRNVNNVRYADDNTLKAEIRDIMLPRKVHPVKAMDSPVVIYGCNSWTMKKAEHRRIDAFERWCCRRLWRVPWTARRSNQPILKKISPENINWKD